VPYAIDAVGDGPGAVVAPIRYAHETEVAVADDRRDVPRLRHPAEADDADSNRFSHG